ncbi:MAG: hypothetical protein HFG32_13810 [Eubacterium sp.]|nr:hypothetical protein [Clostridia bacterium]MCI9421046.1 hypothetical protein [Eubacterium sp.]
MKEISKKTKIVALLIVAVIVIGMIITFTIGLNFDLRYQEAKSMELYLQKEFETADMKQITDEMLPNQAVMIQKVEMFEDTVRILAKEITEEQKNNIVNKVNEKYGIELKTETIQISNIPHTRGRDIVKPYLLPFGIATIMILAYIAIRYYRLGMWKILAKTVVLLGIAQLTLLSIMAIARIPIGRVTIPLVLAVYVLSLIGITTYLEKKLKEKREKEEK